MITETMADDLCTQLDPRHMILPRDGNFEVTEDFLTSIRQLLEIREHTKLSAAHGVAMRRGRPISRA